MIEFEVTKISTGEKRRFDFSDLAAFELHGINSPEDCEKCDGVWIRFKDPSLDCFLQELSVTKCNAKV